MVATHRTIGEIRQDVMSALRASRFVQIYGDLGQTRARRLRTRCPLHGGRDPNFSVDTESGGWTCFSRCGSGSPFDFVMKMENVRYKEAVLRLAARCGVDVERRATSVGSPRRSSRASSLASVESRLSEGTFTAEFARRCWCRSMEIATDDDLLEDERVASVHEFLARRGLSGAFEFRLYGIVDRSMDGLRFGSRSWADSGHRLVCPLYDVETGELVSLQGRCVVEIEPRFRVLTPKGGRSSGTVFCNAPEVLRGESDRPGVFLLLEGMTDFLAMATALPESVVLSLTGASMARRAVGPWIRGRPILVCSDADPAGDEAAMAFAREALREGERPRRLVLPRECGDVCDVVERVGTDGLRELVGRALSGAV